MSDLTDARIDAISRRAKVESSATQYLIDDMQSMALELQRHRRAQAASKARVHEVVCQAFSSVEELAGHPAWPSVARYVADQLAAPAALSAEEREILGRMRNEAASGMLCWKGWPREGVLARMVALLDRLLGAKT